MSTFLENFPVFLLSSINIPVSFLNATIKTFQHSQFQQDKNDMQLRSCIFSYSFKNLFSPFLSFKNHVFQRAPILLCYEKFTRIIYTLPSAMPKIAHGLQSYLTMIHLQGRQSRTETESQKLRTQPTRCQAQTYLPPSRHHSKRYPAAAWTQPPLHGFQLWYLSSRRHELKHSSS